MIFCTQCIALRAIKPQTFYLIAALALCILFTRIDFAISDQLTITRRCMYSFCFQSKMDSLSVLSPRSSGEFIASHAKHIQIHDAGIDKCCHLLTQRLKDGTFSSKKLFAKTEVHPQEANEKGIDWVFFADALNFSFWTQDHELQYLVTYKARSKFLIRYSTHLHYFFGNPPRD